MEKLKLWAKLKHKAKCNYSGLYSFIYILLQSRGKHEKIIKFHNAQTVNFPTSSL